MSFGGHLRALREAAALSRAELARRVGVPASTLRHWEADRGMPGMPASLRLAEVLGVPVEQLAEGVEDLAGEERTHTLTSPRPRGIVNSEIASWPRVWCSVWFCGDPHVQ